MFKRRYHIHITIFLVTLFLSGFLTISGLNAQVPPPPPNGGPNSGHGQGGNQPAGATAPIDGGLGILLVLGTVYAARKSVASFNSQRS